MALRSAVSRHLEHRWGRAGGGIDDEIFPQRMEVDYVRIYKLD